MPLTNSVLSTTTIFSNRTSSIDQSNAVNQIDSDKKIINLTDDYHDTNSQTITLENLQKIILSKDQQIERLTLAIQAAKIQQIQKTLQVQRLTFQNQNVAQILLTSTKIQKQNFHLKQKLILYEQVNQRQYEQGINLQKEKSLLNLKISELQQILKSQESANSMKLTQIKIELSNERKKNMQFEKQIIILKAIIKQLQEDQDTSDDDGSSIQNHQKKHIGSQLNQTNFNNCGVINFSGNHEKSIQAVNCIRKQNCQFYIQKGSFYKRQDENCADLQEEIVFM